MEQALQGHEHIKSQMGHEIAQLNAQLADLGQRLQHQQARNAQLEAFLTRAAQQAQQATTQHAARLQTSPAQQQQAQQLQAPQHQQQQAQQLQAPQHLMQTGRP
jgi:hypothetical protein